LLFIIDDKTHRTSHNLKASTNNKSKIKVNKLTMHTMTYLSLQRLEVHWIW